MHLIVLQRERRKHNGEISNKIIQENLSDLRKTSIKRKYYFNREERKDNAACYAQEIGCQNYIHQTLKKYGEIVSLY